MTFLGDMEVTLLDIKEYDHGATNVGGRTALMRTAKSGHGRVVKMMLHGTMLA